MGRPLCFGIIVHFRVKSIRFIEFAGVNQPKSLRRIV
jgi:hypothetical protein